MATIATYAGRPAVRRLRVFAFDPSFGWDPELAVLNETTLAIPWEDLLPGPVGEYLEVVDIDPGSSSCYPPVDLDDPYLLAQHGLPPSEGSPQFHQQMVYAVAMTAIQSFEAALGRRVLWADGGPGTDRDFVQRLRLHPHALLEANAHYLPEKKAIVFGYFRAAPADGTAQMPGGTVFTCLAHDVVAHETTHALLDGLHRRFQEQNEPDSRAFHEAFADLVALFQRFSNESALRHQIAHTRGNLADRTVLAEIAHQWGAATGQRGALRDALGEMDPQTGAWRSKPPDPGALRAATEEHARGAILAAAVFDAFVAIYRARTADLLRLATQGSGILPPGALHPDLVGRLAREAANTAAHILAMCIRALDYCPPVDVDFGDFLRALVTADRDLIPTDDRRYRLAMVEAFRQRGIFPDGVPSLAEESVLWPPPAAGAAGALRGLFQGAPQLAELRPETARRFGRRQAWEAMRRAAATLHDRLAAGYEPGSGLDLALGLALDPARAPRSIDRDAAGRPKLEVHSVRPACRVSPDGDVLSDLVVEITQQRRAYFEPADQARAEAGELPPAGPDFLFRGGCTLIVDLASRQVRYAIVKSIADERRRVLQCARLSGQDPDSLAATYFGRAVQQRRD
jgi:hypothetical protein